VSAEEVKPYSDIQVGRQKSAEVIVFGIRAVKKNAGELTNKEGLNMECL